MSLKVPSRIATTFRIRARVVVAALVVATLHGLGIVLTEKFALSATSFLGGMLLFVAPVVIGSSFGFKLFDRLFGEDRTWTAPSGAYLKKMAALVFALSVALFLLQQTKRPVTVPTGATGQVAVPTASTPDAPPGSEPVETAPVTEPEPAAAEQVLVATALSEDLPTDMPGLGGKYETYNRLFDLPEDTVPQELGERFAGITDVTGLLLPMQEGGRYYRGLVRSGLEVIGLCRPGVACPAKVRMQLTEWTDLRATMIQATFTTPLTWNEIVFLDYKQEEWGWRKTSTGWQSIGALSAPPDFLPQGMRQYHRPKINEKARDAFQKLLACTYVEDRCKN